MSAPVAANLELKFLAVSMAMVLLPEVIRLQAILVRGLVVVLVVVLVAIPVSDLVQELLPESALPVLAQVPGCASVRPCRRAGPRALEVP